MQWWDDAPGDPMERDGERILEHQQQLIDYVSDGKRDKWFNVSYLQSTAWYRKV